MSADSFIEIGFFGGNFTGVNIEKQEELLSAATKYILNKTVKAIRISTRPDYINDEILNFLQQYFVSTIELGAQSFDDEVLKLSGRGHDSKTIITASHLIKKSGFNLGLQIMVGLPGDTIEKAILTARKIVELKADCTRIYPTLVIKDTPLEKLFFAQKYHPLSIEESIRIVKEVYKIFEEAGIKILRVGLHPSEGLISKETYIAGPFHFSFRELVLSDLWKDLLKPLFDFPKNNKLILSVAENEVRNAIGYGSSNKKMLQNHFSHINFVPDPFLTGRNFYVNHC